MSGYAGSEFCFKKTLLLVCNAMFKKSFNESFHEKNTEETILQIACCGASVVKLAALRMWFRQIDLVYFSTLVVVLKQKS
jgi:hypothetical protein